MRPALLFFSVAILGAGCADLGGNPDDLAWDGDCLHVSTPLQGKLLTLCSCP